MKIPKSINLPRKLKKELKKGFTRNVQNYLPKFSDNPGVVSYSMYQTVSYSGSNTKSFRRLCKFARKDEKRMYNEMVWNAINNQFDCLVDSENELTEQDLIDFQRKVF